MTSTNTNLIITSTLFLVLLGVMIFLIVYTLVVKNKIKNCSVQCNDGNCSVLPTGIYQISAGNVSLLQANAGDLGYVYVGNTTDNVPNGVTLTSDWQVICLPSSTTGQSLIGLFNTMPDGMQSQNALQKNTVTIGNTSIVGSKMTSLSGSSVDPTYAQWFNVLPQSGGGYKLMTSGDYFAIDQTPINSGANFSTSLTANPDAAFYSISSVPSGFTTTLTFTPV